jgi:hypothetical protein
MYTSSRKKVRPDVSDNVSGRFHFWPAAAGGLAAAFLTIWPQFPVSIVAVCIGLPAVIRF